jgi:uncharacterized protein
MSDIFESARKGEVETVKQLLAAGADVNAVNEYNFSALHCAAMGANSVDNGLIVDIMQMLINAGANLEQIGGGGRTALFLAAEFSKTIAPVQTLLDAGAKANIYNEAGIHIVINAGLRSVQELLSQMTGVPIPPPEIEMPSVKMNAAQWKAAKLKIDAVFADLSKAGLVTLQNAGTTQDDGFSDCAEQFAALGGINANLHGFCWYSGQDLSRAKRTSQLSLAFWGAALDGTTEGTPKDMERVGKLIVDAFKADGFLVNWNGSGRTRPAVYLI